MTAALTVAEVLERAADLIEPEGRWTQGAFNRDPDGMAELDEDHLATENPVCWCALGAIAHVAGADPLSIGTFSLLATTITSEAYANLRLQVEGDIPSFNDDPSRTQAEVVAALRAAAVIAKGGL